MPEPTSDELRALAADITARPEYDLVPRRVDMGWTSDLLLEIIDWVIAPFRWIYRLTEGLPEVFRWLIVLALIVALVALVGHIIYSLAGAMRGGTGGKVPDEGSRRKVDPAEWEHRAATAAAAGEYITAVRHLFRASLGRLEQAEKKPFRPGTTNRDLLKRYRTRTDIVEGLKLFVDTIDRKWYGDEVCTEHDYAVCSAAHGELRRAALPGGAHAVGT